ncbi:hypothetical protein BCD67_08480 [Oscillatoriales cyanobacterium USR001]|nr:hypothetical protein BCD67_08480 [Oscillatoriales cyanobacterium USR001]
MADTLRASEDGLKIVEEAKGRKRWTQEKWRQVAFTSISTLKRFLNGERIDRYAFIAICEAVGVNWEKVAELTEIQETELPVVSPVKETPSVQNVNFVGRENAIAYLNTRINQGSKIILIQAPGGVGKTTLAQEYLKSQGFDLILELLMAKEKENITLVESVIEEWLKRDFQEEPGREFGVTLGRLKRQLQTRRVGVLIDNLEPALDAQGRFIEPHRRYVDLLRVLADSSVQSVTLITSREPLAESVGVTNYSLPSLDEKAWQDFFSRRDIEIDAITLKEMHKAYGGNALAMTILCDPIQRDRGMVAYWQEHKVEAGLLVELAVENLVKEQFNRLEKTYPEAYKLLCRLGCYRYQDVPTVPTEGLLCLLWDVPEGQRRRVIESLRNRSLVEFNKGEYWLHPVIRTEAIARLRDSEDWEKANRHAAEFFSKNKAEINSSEDGIIVFESFHHYCSIIDWSSAFKLLEQPINFGDQSIKLREQLRFWGYSKYLLDSLKKLEGKLSNTTEEGQRLGSIGVSYYALGNYTQAIEYLAKAEELFKSTSTYYYAFALSWLGKSNARLGNFSLAISYCNQALEQVEKLKEMQQDDGGCECTTLNTIGFIYVDLAEYEIAREKHKEVMELSKKSGIPYLRNEGDALAYIACCEWAMGNPTEAINKFQESIKVFNQIKDYLSECIAHCLLVELYLSNGQIENAGKTIKLIEILNEKIKYFHPILKTNLFKTQAIFSLYNNNYEQAIKLFQDSIAINNEIGAKNDLAEAYYQLGLTYQTIGNTADSQENFNKAIQLFTEMDAPRQVDKVQQAAGKLI